MFWAIDLVTLIAFVLLQFALTTSFTTCEDIDAIACKDMYSQNPHICDDTILSNTACPKLCNKCPLVCYNCNMTSGTNNCNLNTCATGEVCGTAGWIKCCSEPLCNDPSVLNTPTTSKTTTPIFTTNMTAPTTTGRTTTTTKIKTTQVTTMSPTTVTTAGNTATFTPTIPAKRACHKDIIFVVDESPSMSPHWTHVTSFAKSLVQQINIGGVSGSRLSFTTFTTTANTRWQLNSYASASGLERVLADARRNGIYRADNLVGVKYVNNQALSRANGNRRDASDVVIFISGDNMLSPTLDMAAQVQRNETAALHEHFKSIIAIRIGSTVNTHQMSLIATGSSHMFFIPSGSDFKTIENKVLHLICDI